MAMVRELLQMPERAEPMVPPSLTGAPVEPTKFHLLRRSALVKLARAFAVKIPDGATKEQLVRYMTQAEENGVFRSKPKSPYHLLHAELDHDLYGQHQTAAQQEAIRAALVPLEHEEFPAAEYDPPPPDDGRTLSELQARATELGINIMAKTKPVLRRLIAVAEKAQGLADAKDAAG